MSIANEGHSNWITVTCLLVRSASEAVKRTGGVNLTQFRILVYLSHHEDCNVKQVSDVLGLNPSTVSLAISNLEGIGACLRNYPDADRRIVLMRITPKGTDILNAVDPVIEDLAHEFWSVYDDAELAMTKRDSAATASLFGRTYIKDGSASVETAYVDAGIVILAKLERQMKRANISLNEYRILYLLSENPRGMRPSDIGRSLFLRSSETTQAIDKLVKHARVQRTRDAADRRSNIVSITTAGYDKLKKTTPHVVDMLKSDICPLEQDSFARYDSIAAKVVQQQQRHYLMR